MKTLFVYVLLFHLVKSLCDALLPNIHIANRIRGKLFGLFFAECGSRVAIASGCIINSPWNLRVQSDVYIAHRCWINAAAGLVIGQGVIISPNVVIATTAHGRVGGKVSLVMSCQSPISIGAGSWIASNSVIVKGSVIGQGVIVGATSLVRGVLHDNSLYAGNPIKRIRSLTDDELNAFRQPVKVK